MNDKAQIGTRVHRFLAGSLHQEAAIRAFGISKRPVLVVMGALSLAMVAFVFAQDTQSSFEKLDKEMGSFRLGASPTVPPVGMLAIDGEQVCGRLPFSSCGYQVDAYMYYFRGGVLTSKSFEFSEKFTIGPWKLEHGDTKDEVVTKLRPFVRDSEPTEIGDVLFYGFDCTPRLCRLDIQMMNGSIGSIRLYYSDIV